MEAQFTVLENGLDFILQSVNELAVAGEDGVDEDTQKRLIKYALVHISAGIELVLKYKLMQEHWTYVFADMNKANKDKLISGDFKSVDSEMTIQRLDDLCGIKLKQTDINELKNLRLKRNKVEHFEFKDTLLSVESSIHKCISIIVKTVVDNYKIDGFSEHESSLFYDLKTVLRKLDQHYDDVRAIAEKELQQLGKHYHVAVCPKCGEKLLICDCDVRCLFCGYEDSSEEAARNYIDCMMEFNAYAAAKDGDEYPLYICPECEVEALVLDSEFKNVICFNCGFECDAHELTFCSDCGLPYYTPDGDEIGLCASCARHRFEKDD